MEILQPDSCTAWLNCLWIGLNRAPEMAVSVIASFRVQRSCVYLCVSVCSMCWVKWPLTQILIFSSKMDSYIFPLQKHISVWWNPNETEADAWKWVFGSREEFLLVPVTLPQVLGRAGSRRWMCVLQCQVPSQGRWIKPFSSEFNIVRHWESWTFQLDWSSDFNAKSEESMGGVCLGLTFHDEIVIQLWGQCPNC